jgi:hypothetical protein
MVCSAPCVMAPRTKLCAGPFASRRHGERFAPEAAPQPKFGWLHDVASRSGGIRGMVAISLARYHVLN